MKPTLIFASLILSGGLAQAASPSNHDVLTKDDPEEFDVQSADGLGAIDALITCTRNLVTDKRGGSNGIRMAAKLINDVTPNAAIDPLLDQCNDYYRTHPKIEITRNQQLAVLNSIPSLSSTTRSVMTKFIRPKAKCTQLAVTAEVALILGVSGNTLVGHCVANNGSVWLQAGFGMGIGLGGGGAVVGASANSLRFKNIDMTIPFSFSETSDVAAALGLGLRISHPTNRANSSMFTTASLNPVVGLGVVGSNTVNLNIKVLPLLPDNSDLINQLAGPNWSRSR